MALIYEDALAKEISADRLCGAYLIFGDDTYLKKYYADKISDKAYGGDPFFNLQKFDGNADLQEVYDAVKQYPMMADSKCVTLTDYDFEHASKSDFDKLCDLLCDNTDGCVFIVRFDSIEFDDKRNAKAKKLISSVEKGGGKAVKLDHRRGAVLVKMLTDGAKKRKCTMPDNVAKHLIETCGEDLSTLKNELDKLCSYANGSEITKETVDLVCIKSVESSVYDYVKQIFALDVSGALKQLDNMFFMHIEPMIILYTASATYVDMYRVFTALNAGKKISDVSSDFGYKNKAFVLDRAKTDLKKMNREKLLLSFEALMSADKKLKSFGLEPRTVLEQLTVKLIYIIVKGEALD